MEMQAFLNMVIEPWTQGAFSWGPHFFVLNGCMCISVYFFCGPDDPLHYGMIFGVIFYFFPLEFAYWLAYWLPKIVKFLWP